MTAALVPSVRPGPTPVSLARILVAGFAGGAVDFAYASALAIAAGPGFVRVWQGVAAGWLGKAALAGGWGSAILGMATHFAIATAMAATYAVAASRAPVLYRRWYACAPVYGLLLYGVMYRLVLPLRFPGAGGWHGWASVLDILSHVGLALAAAFVLSRRSGTARR